MPVNVEQTAAFAALAKSFTSSYEARDKLMGALREHLGVTARDSFWMSDDGIDDVLGPVVIYQFSRGVFDGNGGLPAPGSADSFFRSTYSRTADGFVFGEPVAVRRKTDYVRDSAADESAEPASDEAELPAWLAEALARAAGLTKGAGHKYIRRVPKSGGGYRYFYKVSGGKGLGHEDEMAAGAKFRVTHGGKDGHFEIVGKDDKGNLRIKHDESGHESVVSPAALRSMLHAEHAQSLTAHRKKLAADIKAAADPKAKARLLAEAGKYEHTRDLAGGTVPVDRKQYLIDSFRRQGEDHSRISQSGPDATQRALYAESGRLHTHAADLMAQHKEGAAWPEHVQDAMTAARNAHEKAYKHVPAATPAAPAKPDNVLQFPAKPKAAAEPAKPQGGEKAAPAAPDAPVARRAGETWDDVAKRHKDIADAHWAARDIPAWGNENDKANAPKAAAAYLDKVATNTHVLQHIADNGLKPDSGMNKHTISVVQAMAKERLHGSGPETYRGGGEWDVHLPAPEAEPAKPQGGEKPHNPGGTLPTPAGAKSDPRDAWNKDHGHLADRIVSDMAPGENGGVRARYKTFEHGGKTSTAAGEMHGQYGVHQSDAGDDRIDKSPEYTVTHIPTGMRLGNPMNAEDAHSLAKFFDAKHKHSGHGAGLGGQLAPEDFKKMGATYKKFMEQRYKQISKVQKSMSSITDPERDLAKSLAASHRAAAERQPDAGARAAHEAAAQACDAAAEADGTADYRKALGAAVGLGGLVKAWSNIPDAQRPPFADFRKSMEHPAPARSFPVVMSSGGGDALGHLPAVVEGSRPPAEVTTQASPEPTTYSAQRGAVNGMRKSMGAFYGKLAAGAAQARLDVRFPAEAAPPAGGR